MRISVRQIGGVMGLQFGCDVNTDDLPAETAAQISRLITEVGFFSLPPEIREINGRDGLRHKLIIQDGSRVHSVLFDSTAYATTNQLKDITALVSANSEMQLMPPVFSDGV